MTRTARRAALAGALALAAAACGGLEGIDLWGGGPDGPAGEWRLVDGEHAGEPVPGLEDHGITLEIDGDQWGGSTPCNTYGATVAVRGERLVIEQLFQTEAACVEQRRMEAEAAYLDAFATVDRYAQTDGELLLEGDDVELRYEPIPEEPDAALEGTEWRLTSLVEGSGPDGAVSSVRGEPTIVFEPDGRLVAHGACRTITAAWERTDDGVRITDPGYDDVGCPSELEAQDEFLRSVLDGGLDVTIEGAALRLSHPDGRGLDLRAP